MHKCRSIGYDVMSYTQLYFTINMVLDFCRAMLCISAAYAVMHAVHVCLYVCLSATFVDVKRSNRIFQFFSPSGIATLS